MKPFYYLIYGILQVVLFPIALLGLALATFKQVIGSRLLGVSATGIEVINARWEMHIFGMRSDEASVKLNKTLPNNSLLGLWLQFIPLYTLYKISGQNLIYPRYVDPHEATLRDVPIVRTLCLDKLINKSKDEVEQFVLMGAGYDTRCSDMLVNTSLKHYEIDMKQTQILKIDYLKKAEIPWDHITFVDVDFTKEDWYDRLEENGFDSSKKTMFLWEGVTLYLSEDDIRHTINSIRDRCAKGSVLIADFYSESFVKGEYVTGLGWALKMFHITNEYTDYGMKFSTEHEKFFKDFVTSTEMNLGDHFFLGSISDKGPYMVVAEFSN